MLNAGRSSKEWHIMQNYIIIEGQKLANIGALDANWNAMQVLGDGPFIKRGTNALAFHNPLNYIELRRLLLKQRYCNDSILSLNV